MVRHRLRLAATGLGMGLLLALVAAPTAAHSAPPVTPGPVTGLTIAMDKSTGTNNYTVAASWNAATDATQYEVALADAQTGTALAGTTVTVTSWIASVNLTGVKQVRLVVTPRTTKKTGPAATVTADVQDLSAPNGTFEVSWVDRTGTITQTSLTDDGPLGEVTRTVNWGDNTLPQDWATGNTINHLYAAEGLYRPTVTVKDGVGNSRVVQLAPIVPGDKTAPVGTFTTSRTMAWKSLTPVHLTQTSLSDDFSAAVDVQRWVDWGDGGGAQSWPVSVTTSHVYTATGTYTPQVVVKDEAGNTRQVPAPAVTVAVDTVLPVVKLTLPKKAVADEVSSWKKVTGGATDAQGSGVTLVAVAAIEKRTGGWYFYKATSKTWLKAATKAKAWKRATAAVAKPDASGEFLVRLAGLRNGSLFVRATATDLAANVSKPVTNKAVLTAP